jgi:hypothetical protein
MIIEGIQHQYCTGTGPGLLVRKSQRSGVAFGGLPV